MLVSTHKHNGIPCLIANCKIPPDEPTQITLITQAPRNDSKPIPIPDPTWLNPTTEKVAQSSLLDRVSALEIRVAAIEAKIGIV
jgi:hypothetical protein